MRKKFSVEMSKSALEPDQVVIETTTNGYSSTLLRLTRQESLVLAMTIVSYWAEALHEKEIE